MTQMTCKKQIKKTNDLTTGLNIKNKVFGKKYVQHFISIFILKHIKDTN